eukprot:TRINITY_DN48954_c0_g1_i1.p2 TRINITY_DN48954_c0_g1~~TRINITY_DN48954_c0_g1_i1.p2  ORF type:complete len:260 (-),score=76.63 TRINITY_DN48954_c0_g1_i1:496-1275(-)
MASFKLLGEEQKIIRRKEKEAERQKKIQDHIQQVANAAGVSSWADASDEEEEDAKIFRPVSDSESVSSGSEDDFETKQGNIDKDHGCDKGDKSVDTPKKDVDAKVVTKPKKGKKKDAKQPKDPAAEEDLDEVLAEFGIDLGVQQQEKTVESNSSRRRKKKERESPEVNSDVIAGAKEVAENGKLEDEQKALEQKDRGCEGEEEQAIGEEQRKAALEALKKKQGTKKTSTSSSAAKCALAEAKKKASEKKTKRDKSMYDL